MIATDEARKLQLTTHSDDVELSAVELRALAHQVTELVIQKIMSPNANTVSSATRAELDELLMSAPPADGCGAGALVQMIRDHLFPHTREYRHPLHFGHQRPAPLAATVVADLAVGALNPSVTMFEGGPYAFALERRVIRWMCELAGFSTESDPASDGVMVSGGSEANLTALLCARERAVRERDSQPDGRRQLVFTSADAHYSVARAAHVIGLGMESVVPIAVNQRREIEPQLLARAMHAAAARGDVPIAVVATAGTTSVGAFDDLRACGAVAREHNAWFHVDGAHGASALLHPTLRRKLDGVALADSLTWDPHKLMWVAAPCSVLLVRERANLTLALQPGMTSATYLVPTERGPDPQQDLTTFGTTIACTRYATAVRVYAAFLVYGQAGLARRLERMCTLAEHLFYEAQAYDGMSVLTRPDLNIVCLRHLPRGIAEPRDDDDTARANAHTRRVREKLAQGSQAYVTGVDIDGHYWLRAQLMSENITKASITALLRLVTRTSAALADDLDRNSKEG
ncbi:MAG: lysine decarboxylase DesA [Haliangiales bacterium]